MWAVKADHLNNCLTLVRCTHCCFGFSFMHFIQSSVLEKYCSVEPFIIVLNTYKTSTLLNV